MTQFPPLKVCALCKDLLLIFTQQGGMPLAFCYTEKPVMSFGFVLDILLPTSLWEHFSQLKVALCWAELNNSTWITPPGCYFAHMCWNLRLREVLYGVKYHWHQPVFCTLWTNSLVTLLVNALIWNGKRCLRFYFFKAIPGILIVQFGLHNKFRSKYALRQNIKVSLSTEQQN